MRALKLTIWVVVNVGVFAALLLVPAATIDWPRAWVFIALVLVALSVIAAKVMAHSEGLLDERLKSPLQQGQPLADKIILILCLAAWGGLLAFIPLDVFRFHLLRPPNFFVSGLGLMLAAVGWWVMYLSFRENAFAASVIRHQSEREQVVIANGIYGRVRHPLYAGGSIVWIGVSLWLGSYAAALLTLVPIGTIALRISVEERFLRRELRGYDAYSARVRWRLFPLLW